MEDESATIINPQVLKRVCVLGTLQMIYNALAAAAEEPARLALRADLYERLVSPGDPFGVRGTGPERRWRGRCGAPAGCPGTGARMRIDRGRCGCATGSSVGSVREPPRSLDCRRSFPALVRTGSGRAERTVRRRAEACSHGRPNPWRLFCGPYRVEGITGRQAASGTGRDGRCDVGILSLLAEAGSGLPDLTSLGAAGMMGAMWHVGTADQPAARDAA